jgi:hypothetical protein
MIPCEKCILLSICKEKIIDSVRFNNHGFFTLYDKCDLLWDYLSDENVNRIVLNKRIDVMIDFFFPHVRKLKNGNEIDYHFHLRPRSKETSHIIRIWNGKELKG